MPGILNLSVILLVAKCLTEQSDNSGERTRSETNNAGKISISAGDANGDVTRPMTSFPLNGASQQQCVSYNGFYLNKTTLIIAIKVNTLKHCSNYCRFTRYCQMFSFHFGTRTCSLHRQTPPKLGVKPYLNLAIGNMNCLECLGDINDIVEHSKSGILIEGRDRRCMTATNTEYNLANKTNGYKLKWGACHKADKWVMNWTSNDRDFISISKLNSDWGLDGTFIPGYGYFAYLTKKEAISNKGLLIMRNSWIFGDECTFGMEGPLADGRYKYLYFGDPAYHYMTMGLAFSVPIVNLTCHAKQFWVRNGELVNKNKLPFFLPNSSVTIRCKPGYGIKALGFLSYQDVTCAPNVRPRHCSRIEPNKMNGIYLGVAIIMSLLALLAWVGVVKKCFG